MFLGKIQIIPTIAEMLMTFKECLDKMGTEYAMKKAIAEGSLFRMEKGIYSDSHDRVSEEEIIQKKYPCAVVTLKSAFMYYSYSDFIPDKYDLATDAKSARIADRRVLQYYMPEGTLEIGKTELDYDGIKIRTYDLERLLIELVRYQTKLPYDYYKEVIGNYRNNVNKLYPAKLDDYLEHFPRRDAIERAIEREVF